MVVSRSAAGGDGGDHQSRRATAIAAGTASSLALAELCQTITFGALAGKTNGDPDFSVSATRFDDNLARGFDCQSDRLRDIPARWPSRLRCP